MAKAPQMRTIDDNYFEFFPLSPKEAIKVLTRLVKLVGEPLGLVGDQIAASSPNGGGLLKSIVDSNIPSDAFGRAAKALVERLDEDEVYETISLLITKVWGQFEGDKGTRRLNIEVDFQGEIALLFKVVVAAIEVNFGDFFGGSLAGVISRGNVSRGMSQQAATSIG